MRRSKNRKFVIARHEAISFRRLLHSFFVRNDVNKRALLVFLVLGSTLSSFAQTSNKKRVLVIPPSRFEFVSEFDLEVIAEKNNVPVAKVFVTYEKALLNTFSKYNDENFEFVPVEAAALRPYKKMVKYKYGKFNGKHYNGVDLKLFSKADFTK